MCIQGIPVVHSLLNTACNKQFNLCNMHTKGAEITHNPENSNPLFNIILFLKR